LNLRGGVGPILKAGRPEAQSRSASALGSFECGALSVVWRIRVVVQIEFGNSAKAKSEFGLGVSLGINWSRVKAAADEWVLEKP